VTDSFQDANDEVIQPTSMMPSRAPLPAGFAVRLSDRRGVSSRSNYPSDEIYREPSVGEAELVLSVTMPLAISLHALHCGILVFDFSNNTDFCGGELPSMSLVSDDIYKAASAVRQELVAKRSSYINAFLSTLWVGAQQAGTGIGPQPTINLGNYQTAEIVNGAWRTYGPGAAPPPGGWPPTSVYMPGDMFRNAVSTFGAIYKAFEGDTFELLPLLQECAAHYQNHQFSAALVVGWSVAEAILARRWRTYLSVADSRSGGPTAISRDRRKRLEGRDFSASIVTEALSLAGRLDEPHRESLDVARRARNAFAHQLSQCDPVKAFLGASVAAQMIGQDAGCDFRVGSGYSYQL